MTNVSASKGFSPSNSDFGSVRRITSDCGDYFDYELVDTLSQFNSLNFYGSPKEIRYATTLSDLPGPLKNKETLTGTGTGTDSSSSNGIFYFVGNGTVLNQAIAKKTKTCRNLAPIFLYIKYYSHIAEKNCRAGVCIGKAYVATAKFPDVDQIKYLPETQDFRWNEVLIEINTGEPSSNFGIEFGARQFNNYDYFLVEKFALIYGKESPCLEEIRELFKLEPRPGPESESEPGPEEVQPKPRSCLYSILRCIFFPVALALNIIMWPLIWFCCPGGREKRSEYQRYES